MSSHEYRLFIRSTCPFCMKVIRYMDSEGIEIPMTDINSDPFAADDLVAIGGKQQVPCLLVDGKAMYESDDIIAYMGNNLSEFK